MAKESSLEDKLNEKKSRPRVSPKPEDKTYDETLGEIGVSYHEKPKYQNTIRNKNVYERVKRGSIRQRATKIQGDKSGELLGKILGKVDKAIDSADQKERYNYFIEESRRIIEKYGIDRIIVHGNPITDKRKEMWGVGWDEEHPIPENFKEKSGQPPVEMKPDLDIRAALYILDKIHKVKPKIYNQDIFIESIPKGGRKHNEPKRDKKEVMLYLDAGNTNPHIEDTGGGIINIYADHHGIGNPYNTSATKIVNDIFREEIRTNTDLEPEKGNILRLTTFTNKFDNIEYFEEKDRHGKKIFDKEFFINDFPRSLYSLAKFLPFETTLEIINNPSKYKMNGKSLNWLTTFTKDEIGKGDLGKLKVKIQDPDDRMKSNEFTVKELVKKNFSENEEAIKGVENTIQYMKDNNINDESKILGKTIFHNFPEIEVTNFKGKKRKKRNTIQQNIGYLTTRAVGYDSMIFYNPREGTIFINSDGKKDLMPIWQKINAIIPGYPRPIRNKFIYQPTDPAMIAKSKEITEDQWLKILGMERTVKGNPEEVREGTEVENLEQEDQEMKEVTKKENAVKEESIKVIDEIEEREKIRKAKLEEIKIKLDKIRAEKNSIEPELEKPIEVEPVPVVPVVEPRIPSTLVQPDTKKEDALQKIKKDIEDKMETKEQKRAPEILDRKKLEEEVTSILENQLGLKEKGATIKKIKITPNDNKFNIEAEISTDAGSININGELVNNNGLVIMPDKLLKVSIDFWVKVFVSEKKDIRANLPALPEAMKKYFEGKYKEKISTIEIKDGKLQINF
ncbi:MAG: hypothetical protein KBD52_00795 [Candidatus Pacebacteria bacterium]|nr:hypothetical protein [Candidatus Paceibacterota bacterium]